MKKKNLIIIAGAIFVIGISAIIGIGLLGDKPQTKQDIESLIQKNEMIEIEIAVPEDNEQGEIKELDWTILAQLTTYQDTLRTPFDKLFFVRVDNTSGEKIGRPYFNAAGENIQNNTFINACQNKLFMQTLNKTETLQSLSDMACSTYADLEADDVYTNAMIALNGYFNLIPDAQPNYANPDSTITRAEAMALLFRAENPVNENLTVDKDFQTAVGESEYTIYAQALADKGYLNLSDKSLNNQTFNGTITRGEFVYYLMNTYLSEDFANYDVSTDNYIEFSDVKDGGDIATAQGYTKDYGKSYEIFYMINNPDAGVSSDMYKALAFAQRCRIIDSETRWDEGLTKAEAIEMLLSTYNAMAQEQSSDTTTQKDNSYYYDEDGMFDCGFEESGLTFEEDAADGYVGFTVMYNSDGTTYLLYNKDGSRYELLDTLPNGEIYMGRTEADQAAIHEWYMNN